MTTVQMPIQAGQPTKTGRGLWRKMILPAGKTLTVDGRRLDLTPGLLAKVKESFDAGFLDSTPFQLVDGDNRHTDDPERTRGTVRSLELAADGLYATLDVPDALLEHNQTLGVSPRLIFGPGTVRADGRSADVVLKHVAGTLDPHVGGMGAWTRLADLSADPSTPVVDLTAATYQGAPMALSDEQLARLAALADKLNDDGSLKQDDPPAAEAATGTADDSQVSDAELAELLGNLPDDDSTADTTGDAPPVQTSLSAADRNQLDLANAAAQQAIARAEAIEAELAEARWKNMVSSEYAGVRRDLLDLAKPVLAAPDPGVFDLSAADGSKVDVQAIVRGLLAAAPRVDLSAERGMSHSVDRPQGEDDMDFVAAYKRQNSLR